MRNKIYIANRMPREQEEQCAFIDVGKVLSLAYKEDPAKFESEAIFDSFCYFRKIIDEQISERTTRLAFSNVGILLEKPFSLDVSRFFLEYAKDYQVFVLQGPFNIIDGNKLVWNIDKPENKIEFAQGVIETLCQE